MTAKKRIIIPIAVAFAVLLAAAAAFYIYRETYAEPIKKLREKTGIELTGSEKLKKYSRYFVRFEGEEDIGLGYAYKISFSEDDYDDMMEKLGQIPVKEQYWGDEDFINAHAAGIGVPMSKYWLNTKEEEILWWNNRDPILIVVTKINNGTYYAYIYWVYDLYFILCK